jgi:hypothetical protein
VNFLLHRHLAARDLGSELGGVGAMLPDLWRIADRRVRAAASVDAGGGAGSLEPMFSDLLDGIDHHLQLDAWFHGAGVFVEGERALQEELRNASLDAPRMPLFAHVTWELCLDGALLRSIGRDAALAELRAGIAAVSPPRGEGLLSRAADVHCFDRRPRSDEERSVFHARMALILSELARGPWVFAYESAPGIARSVSRIRARVGLAPIDADDDPRLLPVLDRALDRAQAAVAVILARPTYFQATRRVAKRSGSAS